MKRIICSSVNVIAARTPSKALLARSFGTSSSLSTVLSLRTPALASSVLSRHFAKKTINAEPVVSDKQKKQEMMKLLDEEISVLKSTLDDSGDQSLRWEVADRFLKETQFKLEEDTANNVVRLTRSTGDKTVIVTFASKPEQPEYAPSEEDEEFDADEEGEEIPEQAEEDEGEEGEEMGQLKREQPFTVEIKSNRVGREDQKILMNCFASSDGSFVVSELNSGNGKRIPVNIGDWSEELQRELIAYLDPMGINERLSYFIHQYLDRNQQEDNIKILQDFRQFVA
jgi:hypothetical protein